MTKEKQEPSINYKEWLMRDRWDKYETACIFSGVEVKQVLTRNFSGYLALSHPEAQSKLDIMKRWDYGFNPDLPRSPFWFINKALEKDMALPAALLKEVRAYIKKRPVEERDKILKEYGYLSRRFRLALSASDERTLCSEPEAVEMPGEEWIVNARKIYFILRPGNEHLSLEQMAKKVCEEMGRRHSKGEKGMVKRGKKKPPAYSTILRWALQNL